MKFNAQNFRNKSLKVRCIILFTTFTIFMVKAQTKPENTFDFWLGSWNASWKDSIKGTNNVVKILDNKVIEENFSFNDKSFVGKSWSVYDAKSKLWRQTWVDNSGSYMIFAGGTEGDKIVLNMLDKRNKDGRDVSMRMVFFNIRKNSFNWDWQSSEDGKNWKSTWFINYERK